MVAKRLLNYLSKAVGPEGLVVWDVWAFDLLDGPPRRGGPVPTKPDDCSWEPPDLYVEKERPVLRQPLGEPLQDRQGRKLPRETVNCGG